ncbi:MAG: hypothetical protein HY401_03550 [Elusimicrobia bacterium]|nr:hypothetical protein [Elusimicrobiota bacterium]
MFAKLPSLSFRVYGIIAQAGKILAKDNLKKLAATMLIDPVTEDYFLTTPRASNSRRAIVWLKEGVYDAEGDMALYAAKRLGLAQEIEKIKYGRGHIFHPKSKTLNPKSLLNPLVESLEKF